MTGIDSSTFSRELRAKPLSLARANLLFAREIAYPDLKPSHYLFTLNDWADQVRGRCHRTDSVLMRVGHLSDFLFGQLGLQGSRDDYDDPRNSYLNEVIQRRRGLPIALSALFIEIGLQVGLQVEGVGLPGHFIVGVRAEAGRYFFDPFNGGAEVTEDDAAALVRESTGRSDRFDPQWLNPTPAIDIVVRMLVNLRNVYVRAQAWGAAIAVVEHLRTAQPESPLHLRDLGLLHYRNHSPRLAATHLEAYLAKAPQAPDAREMRGRLLAVLETYARLN